MLKPAHIHGIAALLQYEGRLFASSNHKNEDLTEMHILNAGPNFRRLMNRLRNKGLMDRFFFAEHCDALGPLRFEGYPMTKMKISNPFRMRQTGIIRRPSKS